MKNMHFFKYFIKNIVFACGGGGGNGSGPGDPSPLGTGLGVQFLPPIWFRDEGRCMEAGAGTVML